MNSYIMTAFRSCVLMCVSDEFLSITSTPLLMSYIYSLITLLTVQYTVYHLWFSIVLCSVKDCAKDCLTLLLDHKYQSLTWLNTVYTWVDLSNDLGHDLRHDLRLALDRKQDWEQKERLDMLELAGPITVRQPNERQEEEPNGASHQLRMCRLELGMSSW